ncbi:hypothetical protein cgR_5049 [Corynebacterium glutamicum R]|uniref:Uncharacterized protein n=1 Tax=Corynebacterium glutamicum (strain R) TaxID=340322 RepID=A0AB72VDE7_CORGB|nr:hypothetical protein cgR_5049 [Corynebacterium glutamicum R]
MVGEWRRKASFKEVRCRKNPKGLAVSSNNFTFSTRKKVFYDTNFSKLEFS